MFAYGSRAVYRRAQFIPLERFLQHAKLLLLEESSQEQVRQLRTQVQNDTFHKPTCTKTSRYRKREGTHEASC